MVANIFANLMSGMVDKEKITHDTIKNALNEVLAELNEGRHFEDHYKAKDFFLMIKPEKDVFIEGESEVETMSFHIMQIMYEGDRRVGQKIVRQITLKEILGIEE